MKVSIQWKKIKLSEEDKIENFYDFYLFYRGNAIIYIGKSYKQNVLKEIKSKKYVADISWIGIGFYIGFLNKDKSDSFRRSASLITDIESLLINKHQPTENTQCKSNYTGRPDLKIYNSGCKLLKKCITDKSII